MCIYVYVHVDVSECTQCTRFTCTFSCTICMYRLCVHYSNAYILHVLQYLHACFE